MSKENKRTLEVYDKTASTYLENNIVHDNLDLEKAKKKKEKLEELIRVSFSDLPTHAKVLEIGSGDGVNAKYIESLGFDVTATDKAPAFLDAIRSQGLEALELDALEDEFPQKYFAIFCWRVFVHFTHKDALKIIQKAYENLEENGIFIFNAINAETKPIEEEWLDFDGEYHMGMERYYHYFKKEEIDSMVEKFPFTIKDFHLEGGKNKNKWLVYVLKK